MLGAANLNSTGCKGGKNSAANAALPQCFIMTGAFVPWSNFTEIFFIPLPVQTVMLIYWPKLHATSMRSELPSANQNTAQNASSKNSF